MWRTLNTGNGMYKVHFFKILSLANSSHETSTGRLHTSCKSDGRDRSFKLINFNGSTSNFSYTVAIHSVIKTLLHYPAQFTVPHSSPQSKVLNSRILYILVITYRETQYSV